MPNELKIEPRIERRATWLELFYDLMVVAALAATNESFIHHPSGESAVFSVVTLATLFSVWLLTALIHNRFAPDGPVYRTLLLIQMSCILLAAIAINAEHSINWQGGLITLGIALATVSGMYAIARRQAGLPIPGIKIGIVSPLLGALICFVGTTLPHSMLAAVTAAALLVTMTPIAVTFPLHIEGAFPLHPGYLRERLGLLLLIVIGESFLQLVASLTDATQSADFRFFILVVLFNLALAATYFEGLFADEGVAAPRYWRITVFAHFLLILGASAAAAEMAIFASTTLDSWSPASAGVFSIALGVLLAGFAILEWDIKGGLHPLAWVQCTLAAGAIGYGFYEILISQVQTRGEVLILAIAFIGWSLLRVGIAGRAKNEESKARLLT